MELIPQPVYLPGTPGVIIHRIRIAINVFNRWATSPGDRAHDVPILKKQVESKILLGTHKEFQKVWEALEKLENQLTNPNLRLSLLSFIRAIYSALYEESPWGELPPKARGEKHSLIIHTMRRLAKDIKQYDLDQRDLVSYGDTPCDSTWVHYDTPVEGKIADNVSYQDLYHSQTGIQISDLLQKHADKLEHQNRYLAPLTSKTTGDRGLLHFIRTLAIHNKSRYGEHHGALISRVASVYFPDAETEPEKIRASIHALNL